MSARAFLNLVEVTVRATYDPDAVEEWLHPPTREERRARRLAELRAAGLLTHRAVEVT